ncbi:MAG: outer membrane protein assembly factor BamB family protein, partial [Armatimonadota bacterium]
GVIYVPTQLGGKLKVDGYWSADVGRVLALKLNRTTNVFEPQWEYVCPNTTEQVLSSTTVYDGAVYFGGYSTGYEEGHSGVLRTVDLITHTDRSGSPAVTMWKPDCITPGIDKDYVNPSTGQPEPRVYVSDFSCYVTAAKCKTGERMWEKHWDEVSMYASPVVYSGYIYVGSDYNCIYKIDDPGNTAPGEVDGGNVWKYSAPDWVLSTPAAFNGKLYFGCNNDRVYRLDATTFATAESDRSLGSDVLSSPAISSATGMLFVGSLGPTDGMFYVLDASDLQRNVRQNPFTLSGRQIKSSPALIFGRVFIIAGDSNGRYLYCYGD